MDLEPPGFGWSMPAFAASIPLDGGGGGGVYTYLPIEAYLLVSSNWPLAPGRPSRARRLEQKRVEKQRTHDIDAWI